MRKRGFTLVEIMIVVAIIGLLAAIAIPNFIRARATTQLNQCRNNLRQFDAAVQQYALENSMSTGTIAKADLNGYLTNLSDASICPDGVSTYTYGTVGTAASCSTHGSVSTYN